MPRRTPFEKAMHEMLFGETKKERVSLPIKTRREVYEKANKRCQCCGRPLKMNQGVFHHLRKPTVKSRPSTIQFLCSTDHKLYGHKWKTKTVHTMLETQKVPYIVRKRVRKHPSSPHWKKTKSKTTKTRRRRKK